MTRLAAPRRDLAWCSSADVPGEVAAFDDTVEGGLPVGAPGKLGVLDLRLATHGGRTRVERQFQRAPLYLYHPVYLDSHRPDMAFLFVQQSGDGVVQGDRSRIDIDCGPGSAAHITTQATTKIFTARQNYASQLVNLHAGAGAIVEYLPDPTTPFRGSRFFQRTCVKAAAGSTVIMGETLLPGRVAYGENHLYDLYWSETQVRDGTGRLLFSDVLRLCPVAGHRPHSMGLLAGYDVVAALYVVTDQTSLTTMLDLLRAALETCPEVIFGVSELPNACGVCVRVLGSTSLTVQAALRSAWAAARLELLGAPPPNLRKG